MTKHILGHIDCPTCGTKAGMRITHDKNGEPFGYCEANCNQQMRIGGDKRRVAAFAARYPWAMPPAAPVTDTEKKPAPAPKAEPVPAPATATKPAKTRSAFDDALAILGGRT
jgi:hypothetical protein